MFGGHASSGPSPENIDKEIARREEELAEAQESGQTTLASKMCIVISFDIPTDSVEESHAKAREILREVKSTLSDRPNVMVWGAVNETASAIIKVLNEEVEKQDQGTDDPNGNE